MFWFLNLSIILLIILQFINHWNLSKGKLMLVYPLTIVVGVSNIILDAIIAIYNPELSGMVLYTISNIWSIIMATKGLLRLRKEKND